MKKLLILLIIPFFATAQKGNRKLVWEEQFNGKALNEKVWNFETGDGCPNNCGFGNHERQVYTKDNHLVSKGFLTITAKKDGDKYTSTRITTAGKKEFQYGYIETRAKLPVGKGIWPAFWMLGSNISKVGWPKSGEIDIMEYIGRDPHNIYTTLHTNANHGGNASGHKVEIKDIEEGFHTYGVDWSKDKMEFFVDGISVFVFSPDPKNEDNWPFNQPFFILVNMAIGGDFGGPAVDDSIFPQQYTLDYIRVYQ